MIGFLLLTSISLVKLQYLQKCRFCKCTWCQEFMKQKCGRIDPNAKLVQIICSVILHKTRHSKEKQMHNCAQPPFCNFGGQSFKLAYLRGFCKAKFLCFCGTFFFSNMNQLNIQDTNQQILFEVFFYILHFLIIITKTK